MSNLQEQTIFLFLHITELKQFTPVRVDTVTQLIQPALCTHRLMLLKLMKHDTHTRYKLQATPLNRTTMYKQP